MILTSLCTRLVPRPRPSRLGLVSSQLYRTQLLFRAERDLSLASVRAIQFWRDATKFYCVQSKLVVVVSALNGCQQHTICPKYSVSNYVSGLL